MLSIARYGFIVVAPTPNKTAKECVSIASAVSTLIEEYPLKPNLTKFEWIAPTAKIIGTIAFSWEIP